MSVNMRPIGQRISSPISILFLVFKVYQKMMLRMTQPISSTVPITPGR